MFATVFLGAFLLVSFFLTWRSEYQRANHLQSVVSEKPPQPQVQVNLPAEPPPTIVVQQPPPTNTDPAGFLQLEGLEFAKDEDQLVENRTIALNFNLKNAGQAPITDKYGMSMMEFVEQDRGTIGNFDKAEHQVIKEFYKNRREAQTEIRHRAKGPTVGVGLGVYSSVLSDPLTAAQVSGVLSGSIRIYALTWATWKDSHYRPGTLNSCHWLQIPPGPQLVNLVWHTCEEMG
jgi:hypothetical protein